MFTKIVLIDALRSPIGRFGGSLSSYSAVELGQLVLSALLNRVFSPNGGLGSGLGDKSSDKSSDKSANKSNSERKAFAAVQEVFIGNVLSAGLGQNPARQVALGAGLSRDVPATTINMVCGSSLKALIFASQALELGMRDVVVAGGIESMSNAPYLIPNLRWGHKAGDSKLVDSMMKDGLVDAIHQYPMGVTGENVAKRWNISRQDQDEFAARSQAKVAYSESHKLFKSERMDIPLAPTSKFAKSEQSTNQSTGLPQLSRDEHPRADTTVQSLSGLKTVFDTSTHNSPNSPPDSKPATVTAGNSSGINDGAAMVLLTSTDYAAKHKLAPLARLVLTSTVGMDEQIMGYAPYYVIRDLLARSRLHVQDIDIFEINEAFAAQTLAVIRDLDIPIDKVNPLGGAIALGHPIGATGARLAGTLAHQLSRLRASTPKTKPVRGIASLCIGGGQGCGVLLEA